MKILGYSERGIINSLIFNIWEDKVLMDEFIKKIELPKPFELGMPIDYTILLEQSFSRFGDSDLIIIIDYEKSDDRKVLFFEGKVNTSQGKWKIDIQLSNYNKSEQYKGYSSNLFFQLYLKKLLIDNWAVIKEKGSIIEPIFGDDRKIGKNKIVKKAFDLIGHSQAYYIGIIPTLEEDIKNFKGKTDFDLHFLSWQTVHGFCKKNKLTKVLEIFDYNGEQIYKPNN